MILGWDVGGTKSGATVGTADGELAEVRAWESHVERGPDAMLADFLGHARELVEAHPAIDAVGVSIGGPMNPVTGVIIAPPHLPGWENVPLAERLRDELGMPVVVEHDAAACLEAEWLWGSAKGTTHAAYLTCGTGCGAGVLIGGNILRGPNGESPEIGHVRLAPDGPDMFGKRGCVESFCGGTGISKLAPFMFPNQFDAPVDTKRLSELAGGGNECAQAVLDESARRTGQLCSILVDVFCPQVIALGSLARYLGDGWLATIRTSFESEALPDRVSGTRIVPAGLGNTLQPLSAIAPVVFSGTRDLGQ